MTWSKGLEGRRGRPFAMSIEPGKCREFATAVSPADWPLGDTADRSPITFLATSRFWCAPEASAWHGVTRDYRRVLHGEQEFTFVTGPPTPGTHLRALEHVDRVRTKVGRNGEMILTETVISFDEATTGEPIATTRATSITFAQATTPRRDDSPAAPWQPPEQHHLIFDRMTSPLTITDAVRYQGASGDFNPIHHDVDFAHAAGYPGPIAVGMHTAGVAGSCLAQVVDTAGLRRFRARWQSPAWPRDTLRYQVYADDARPGDHVIAVTRQTGQLHMLAEASLGTISEVTP